MNAPAPGLRWQRIRDLLGIAGAGCGAALSLVLIGFLHGIDQVPWFVVVALLALTALTVWRDDAGLLVLAVLVPISSWAGRWWNYYVTWAEALVIAFAAGWFIRRLVHGRRLADDLDPPLRIAAALVVASAAVGLAAFNWRMSGEVASLSFLHDVVARFFVAKSSSDSLDAALRLLESLIVFRAASVAARSRAGFDLRVVRSLVAGATLAGAFNIWSLWEGAQRATSPIPTFLTYLGTIRADFHFRDINAAGSFFVMALFPALGLAWRPGHRKWIVAAAVIAIALWVTGSRAALGAGVLAALALGAHRLLRRNTARARGAVLTIGLLALVTAGAVAYFLPQRPDHVAASVAFRVRWELARTSLRMVATHPIFGVGVGEYYDLSGAFSSPELLALFPAGVHENAHNNLLQIVAELGIVGFAAFGWLLVVAGRQASALLHRRTLESVGWGIVGGLLAFLVTCLGGHPLLIDELAFSFWLLLGVAAGTGTPLSSESKTRRAGSFATLMVIAILLVIPLRTRQQMAVLNMEHAGFGLSAWQPDIDGVRYRFSTGRSTVFLPPDARAVTVPLRPVEQGRALRLELKLDGRPADAVNLPPDRWYELRLILPQAPQQDRFRRLDLEVAGADTSGQNLLMVGKVEPR
jgi:hypothetical protein